MNWLFTDMNAYFASVEQHLRPELRGHAIGVIPVETEYTCIIAASYDAKRCGVKTGTPVIEARRMCPGIKLIKARPNIYVKVHHAILRSVDQCAPVHKVYSIDEWSIQLLAADKKPANAIALARQIKQQIRADFSPWLACSIGIAPTRLLAKIACDLQKPDGLTVLNTDELPGRIDHLDLDDLCGIGQGIIARLGAAGIYNVRDLWAINRQQAIAIWGSIAGGNWWAGLHGYDEPEAPTRRSSMSHARVLAPELRNDPDAHGIFVRLLCKLGARLRHDGYFAHYLRLTLNDIRGGYWCREIELPCVQDTSALLEKFQKLWRQRTPADAAPMKVNVEVAGLVQEGQVERVLFTELEKPRRLSQAIDKINQRWGATAIYFGPMHNYRHHMDDKIAFGRIPPVVG